ncbi:hypothetical protein VPNG_08014 [Cytospora leucostoma]|uniref:Ubiquitin-conjugating enzyme E2C-binding protein n=1 Tax=Cytospora leucostoma TaxID=1230097 RepID=A0A423WRN3_9PEZI|nr:hypothetical protein VPNG_08014 [Cytospora leucostoma]
MTFNQPGTTTYPRSTLLVLLGSGLNRPRFCAMAVDTSMSGGPDTPAKLSIYAELLPRLGRISVVIHLPTPSTHKTKVLVSNDAARLIVYHDNATTELRLPAKTLAPIGEHLPGEVKPGLLKMSWRLVPDPEDVKSSLATDDAVPWSAAQLWPGLPVVCRACKSLVVAEDTLKVFKDLPSENWAEMMELWHCHKPTEHHSAAKSSNGADERGDNGEEKATETNLASRGYGANSAIVAQKGTGFVDLMTMLFHEYDCHCLMQAAKEPPNPCFGEVVPYGSSASGTALPEDPSGFRSLDAICHGCHAQLGRFDNRKNGVSLYKWKLNMAEETSSRFELVDPPTLSHCLAAALVATQARYGTAKVVLQGEKEAVTVWILNPSIRFSCLTKQGVPAMKLLYRLGAVDDVEEIHITDEAIREIKAVLEEGNTYLPPDEKAKAFGGEEDTWTVSLLERWQPM